MIREADDDFINDPDHGEEHKRIYFIIGGD
jgi:hypothetical protein